MPIASTHSATFSFDESPHGRTGRFARVDLEDARCRSPRRRRRSWPAARACRGIVDRDLDAAVADDVVVGQDVAVGRDDDAGAEALRTTFAVAERVVVVAEEVAEERVVRERRVRLRDDLQSTRCSSRWRWHAAATPVRSGSPPVDGRSRRRAAGAGAGCASAGRGASSAVRMRPVRTSPAAKPSDDARHHDGECVGASTGPRFRAVRRGSLGSVTVRTPSLRSAVTAVAVDGRRTRTCARTAVAAFDLVEVAALRQPAADGRAAAADRQPRVLDRELDLLARQPGHLGGDDVAVGGFVDVDRRRPGVGVLRGQASSRSCQARRSRNGSHGMRRS